MKNIILLAIWGMINILPNVFAKNYTSNICIDPSTNKKITLSTDEPCIAPLVAADAEDPHHVTCSIYDFKNKLLGGKEGHFSLTLKEYDMNRKKNVCGKCEGKDYKSRGCNYVRCGYKTSSGVNVHEVGKEAYERVTCNIKPSFYCTIRVGNKENPDLSLQGVNEGVLSSDGKSYTCNYQCNPGEGMRFKTRKFSVTVDQKTGKHVSTEIIKERKLCTDSCFPHPIEKAEPLTVENTNCSAARLCKVPISCSKQVGKGSYKSFALCKQPNGYFCQTMTEAQKKACLKDPNNVTRRELDIEDESSFLIASKELSLKREEIQQSIASLKKEDLSLTDAINNIKKCEQSTTLQDNFWKKDLNNPLSIQNWSDPNEQLNKYFLVNVGKVKGAPKKSELDKLELVKVSKLELVNGGLFNGSKDELIKNAKKEIVKLVGLCPKSDYSKNSFEEFGKNNINNPNGQSVDYTSLDVVKLSGKTEDLAEEIKKFIKEKKDKGLPKNEIQDILDNSWGQGVFSLTSGTDPLLGTLNLELLINNKNLIDKNCKAVQQMVGKSSPACQMYSIVNSQFVKAEKIAEQSCLKDQSKFIKDLEKAAEVSVKDYVSGLKKVVAKGSELCKQGEKGATKLIESIMNQHKDGLNIGVSANKASLEGCKVCQMNTIKMIPSKNSKIDYEQDFDSIVNQQFSDQISGMAICSYQGNKCPSVSDCIKDGSFQKSGKDFTSKVLPAKDKSSGKEK